MSVAHKSWFVFVVVTRISSQYTIWNINGTNSVEIVCSGGFQRSEKVISAISHNYSICAAVAQYYLFFLRGLSNPASYQLC